VLHALPAEVVLVASDGAVLAANEAWQRFVRAHHAPAARAERANYFHVWSSADLVTAADAGRIRDAVGQVVSGIAPRADAEVAARVSPDRTAWLRLDIAPLDPSAPASGVVVTHHDVSAYRQTAGAVQRQVDPSFAAVFEASPVPIVISEVDSDRILHVNAAMLNLLGVSSAAELGKRASSLALWGSEDQRRDIVAQVLAGRAVNNVEVSLDCRTPPHRTLLLSLELVRPAVADEPSTLITMAVDISERRLLEEQFRQSQKIEAVGRLAGGVAHDFNNLLTVIIGYNEALDFDEVLGESAREAVRQIRLATERATMLTRQLLAFSRRQVLQPQTLDLREVTHQLAPMLRRLMGEDIELTTRWGDELAVVRADPGQIEQVLMNLAVNARDAMPQGGRLTIEIGAVEFGPDFVAGHPYVVPGRYLQLVVSDTGTGMTADTRARVFEPFFTTKPQGQGTGLGLAMVYGIVKQSEGYIWVDSETGQGATFRIALPLVEADAVPDRPAPDVARTPGGHETVLLVEDEDALRELDRQILMRYGYRVLHARTGPEAVAVAEAHPGTIQLLLTDVVMPTMSGRELADRLQAAFPEMKVLYMSGYTSDAMVRHGVSEATMAFIQKPMSPPALARKVREVLDS